jgi:hypothetical protein
MSLFSKLFKKEKPESTLPSEAKPSEDVKETVFGKLRSMADPKCHKCYGRGYTCVNTTTKKIHGCSCLRKMQEKKEKLARKQSSPNATVHKLSG